MIYVLAYPEFDPYTARRINRFRTAHEPERAALVPPHVTLVFGLRNADAKAVIALCEKVARATSELRIDFADSKIVYDPYEKNNKIFLVCGNGKDSLKDWHNQLYDGPHRIELNSDISYEPHMTVATHDDRSVLENLDLAEIGTLPLVGTIRALQVVKLDDGTLRTLETVPLRT